MRRRIAVAAALAALTCAPAHARETPKPPPLPDATAGAPPAALADVKTPDAVVAACYDVISGPAGPRDWKRFRSLFLPGARLTVSAVKPGGGARIVQLGVEDYVARDAPFFLKEGFFERGVQAQTLGWAHTATVRSVYESRHAPGDAKPFARGINTFQLVGDGARWWVAALSWEEESPSTPIPASLDR